jgi:hypothetical protein
MFAGPSPNGRNGRGNASELNKVLWVEVFRLDHLNLWALQLWTLFRCWQPDLSVSLLLQMTRCMLSCWHWQHLAAVLVVSPMYANRGPKAPKMVGREELPLPRDSWWFCLKWEDNEGAVSVCVYVVKIATRVVLHFRALPRTRNPCARNLPASSRRHCVVQAEFVCSTAWHESVMLQDRLTRRPKSVTRMCKLLLDTLMPL